VTDSVSNTFVQASQRAGGVKVGYTVQLANAAQQSAIANATGAANAANTTDHTATINSILVALRAIGLIASA
jgi:hypothetical protein